MDSKFALTIIKMHGRPDFQPIEEAAQRTIVFEDQGYGQPDPFDTALHSDPTAFEVIQWTVSSGLAAAVLKSVRDVLIQYLEKRHTVVELSLDEKTVKLTGPLGRKDIDKSLELISKKLNDE